MLKKNFLFAEILFLHHYLPKAERLPSKDSSRGSFQSCWLLFQRLNKYWLSCTSLKIDFDPLRVEQYWRSKIIDIPQEGQNNLSLLGKPGKLKNIPLIKVQPPVCRSQIPRLSWLEWSPSCLASWEAGEKHVPTFSLGFCYFIDDSQITWHNRRT